jgi:hypothetical protein
MVSLPELYTKYTHDCVKGCFQPVGVSVGVGVGVMVGDGVKVWVAVRRRGVRGVGVRVRVGLRGRVGVG